MADAQTLRDHGAAPMLNTDQVHHDSAKKTVKLTTMAGFRGALPPMLTVIGADGVDGDWTVDGVKSLTWPDDSDELMARDYEEMTVLHHAARHGRGYLVDSLIESGADIEAEDVRGFTPLCWVSDRNSTQSRAIYLFELPINDVCLSTSTQLTTSSIMLRSHRLLLAGSRPSFTLYYFPWQ